MSVCTCQVHKCARARNPTLNTCSAGGPRGPCETTPYKGAYHLPTDARPCYLWPHRPRYSSFQAAYCTNPPARRQRSPSEPSSSVALHRTCTHAASQSAMSNAQLEVPSTPARATLSIGIDLVRRWSFRRSDNDTSASRSAHAPKEELTATHLFDARSTLL